MLSLNPRRYCEYTPVIRVLQIYAIIYLWYFGWGMNRLLSYYFQWRGWKTHNNLGAGMGLCQYQSNIGPIRIRTS